MALLNWALGPATLYVDLEMPGLRRKVPEGNLERRVCAGEERRIVAKWTGPMEFDVPSGGNRYNRQISWVKYVDGKCTIAVQWNNIESDEETAPPNLNNITPKICKHPTPFRDSKQFFRVPIAPQN